MVEEAALLRDRGEIPFLLGVRDVHANWKCVAVAWVMRKLDCGTIDQGWTVDPPRW